MLNSRALEAARSAAWSLFEGNNVDFDAAIEASITAFLSASMPEDVKGLLAEMDRGVIPSGEHGGITADDVEAYESVVERALASLSAKVEELTRDNIVAPAECGANCDDPHCHYSHHPLTLRQAYENSLERLRCVETSLAEMTALKDEIKTAHGASVQDGNRLRKELAERDRIIAEKDEALDEAAAEFRRQGFNEDGPMLTVIRAARDRRAS